MYSLGPSKKALVKKESALFFKTFRMYFLLMPSSVRFAYSQKVLMEYRNNLRKVRYIWVKGEKKCITKDYYEMYRN